MQITTKIKKYNSNWEVFVSNIETEEYSAGEFFSGHILVDLDDLDEEDRADYESTITELCKIENLGEFEKKMDEEFITWNVVGQDLR